MNIIEQLEHTKRETLSCFDLKDDDLNRTYGPEKWPVRYILHHLADSETVMYERVRRVLSEPRPVLWVFDQDQWAQALDYSTVPLDLSRRVYEASRDGIIHQARLRYASDGDKEWVHSVTGVRTLRDEIDKAAEHNENHLSQIRMALGRLPKTNAE